MKWSLVFLLSITFSFTSIAQNHIAQRQKIEALKAAFITQKLDLSPEEAQHFWPIYNKYQKEHQELIKLKRQSKSIHSNDPEKELSGEFDFEERLLKLKKQYRQEFLKVLPAQKTLLLYQAEREFREELIKQLRERRQK